MLKMESYSKQPKTTVVCVLLGVMNVDKHDKMEKCFEILKRKSNKDKEKPLNYHFGQFNKKSKDKGFDQISFAYLGQEVEVFDCINLVIIKSELLLSEKNFSEHFWANNYIDLEKL